MNEKTRNEIVAVLKRQGRGDLATVMAGTIIGTLAREIEQGSKRLVDNLKRLDKVVGTDDKLAIQDAAGRALEEAQKLETWFKHTRRTVEPYDTGKKYGKKR